MGMPVGVEVRGFFAAGFFGAAVFAAGGLEAAAAAFAGAGAAAAARTGFEAAGDLAAVFGAGFTADFLSGFFDVVFLVGFLAEEDLADLADLAAAFFAGALRVVAFFALAMSVFPLAGHCMEMWVGGKWFLKYAITSAALRATPLNF
jgi:hypothetical protein